MNVVHSIHRTARGIVLTAILASAWGRITGQPAVLEVSACEAGTSPAKFNNHLISISALYESDGMDSEGISDPRCPGAGTELRIPSTAEGIEKLREALRGGYPGTIDKTIRAKFTGVFHWNPREHPERTLDVRKIEDVTVERKKRPSASSDVRAHVAESSKGAALSLLHEPSHVTR